MTSAHNINQLQYALFQAAKVGNVGLMREFIAAGADPFLLDIKNINAITYAMSIDPIKTGGLLLDLADIMNHSEKKPENF